MVKIQLNNKITQCEHCGAKNIKRTYYISDFDNHLYIGRICLERVTNINTSGNPHNAIKRLRSYLNELEPEELELIWGLKE